MPRLPAYPVAEALPRLRAALREQGRAVLAAPPGSGKTTTVPLALLDEPWLRGKKILMLEPRRIAARAAAARMAWLLGEKAGETVGYQIRFEKKTSATTRIEVITEGLLTRRLQADAELPGVGLVIFDEFHERSLDADLALALTLDARANLNPDLRVLVMSATLDTQRVSKLLDDAPVVESGGKLFPVDIRHLAPKPAADPAETMQLGVLKALSETEGDILAFLPGAREIRATQRLLEARVAGRVNIFPLYGELSSEEQDAALNPTRDGKRKVILATNIAQTSLTVEGVTTVVDGGQVRVARFELGAGANELVTQRVSRASADQRAGRAGRLGPGACYRLWSTDTLLPAHDTPELLAADLSRFALELAAWGVSEPKDLKFLDAPAAASWAYARDLLRDLGAVDGQGRITPHGRELSRLPTTPRRGHLLLLARQQNLAPLAAWTAAALEERDNQLDLANSVQAYLQGRAADPNALRRVRDGARQLARLVDVEDRLLLPPAGGGWVGGLVAQKPPPQPSPSGGGSDASGGNIARLISWAYPERIARRRAGQTGVYLCADGGEARIHEKDALAQSEWLAIAHWDPGPPRKVRLAVRLSEADVLRDHATRITEGRELFWDAQKECVVAEAQKRLGALVLERRVLRELGDEGAKALCAGIRQMGLHVLPWSETTRQWQARVASLRAWRGEEWPDVSDEALLATLEDWLLPHLSGITRKDHLSKLDLLEVLNACFDYAAQQKLSKLAPTHLDVPTGSRIRLDYQPPNAPALEVKLQEMFGCVDTPTVNEGRTRVVLHLLSPGQKPIAVTADLKGFWAGSYADVKKDMKGRYPRHPWPDDPAHALPTRRAKPRGT